MQLLDIAIKHSMKEEINMDAIREEFLNTLVEDKSYDWIANNYHKLSKEELKDIILETLYAIHTTAYLGEEDCILTDARYNLIERWEV